MEYMEDRFQFEQDQLVEHHNYYVLLLDGAEYESGSYETCVEERDRLLKQYGKEYGLSSKDFRIETRTCTF